MTSRLTISSPDGFVERAGWCWRSASVQEVIGHVGDWKLAETYEWARDEWETSIVATAWSIEVATS